MDAARDKNWAFRPSKVIATSRCLDARRAAGRRPPQVPPPTFATSTGTASSRLRPPRGGASREGIEKDITANWDLDSAKAHARMPYRGKTRMLATRCERPSLAQDPLERAVVLAKIANI